MPEYIPPAPVSGSTFPAAASEKKTSSRDQSTPNEHKGTGEAFAGNDDDRPPAAPAGHQVHPSTLESWPRARALLAEAAAFASTTGAGAQTVESVEAALSKHPMSRDEAMDAVTWLDGGDAPGTVFFGRIASADNRHVARAWAEVFSAALPVGKMTEACTASFSACCSRPPRLYLPGMSVLFAYGAEVTPKDIIGLASVLTLEELKQVFLGGVACVENPFTPGISLSVVLEEALKNAPAEKERPILAALQRKLDDLLLEVLELLPQTIANIPGGVDWCEAVFEPEIAGVVREPHFRGPLRLVLQERQFSETLCTAPLVFEYISHRFVAGLPNLQDSNNLLGREPTTTITTVVKTDTGTVSGAGDGRKGRDFLYDEGFVAESALGKLMQGLGWTGWGAKASSLKRPRDWERIFTGTILPGAQFIMIGVLTKPSSYYKVPAVRMGLDLYVHLIMLALYTAVVLEDDNGRLSNTEIVLTFHVLAEIVSNLQHMWADFFEYLRNKWNWLEGLSLALMAGGLFVRIAENGEVLGRGIFALSAPLVFSRVLFFGQILRRQGLVIQMMTILVAEILQFALVLGTIMMGFTVSFFALFKEDRTYGEVWLDVFKAMLGEVGVFDQLYEDSVYRDLGRTLLVFYLLIVAVMLLNLLIAVLSTEHAKVEQQQDKAFRESKVRIMKIYFRMVEGDHMPSPFNLLQLALRLPFSVADRLFGLRTSRMVKREFGEGVAWLMLGPPALLGGWALWIASVPTAVLTVWRRAKFTGESLTFAVVCSSAVVALHAVMLPLLAALFWLWSGLGLLVGAVRELAASFYGNDAGSGGGSGHRDGQSGFFGGTPGRGRGGSQVSVVQLLKPAKETPGAAEQRGRRSRVGRETQQGLNVADIWAYLEDPAATAGLAKRRGQQGKTATWDQVNRMRNQLDAADRDWSEAVLARLAVFDTDLKAAIAELVERSVERALRSSLGGNALDSLVEEKVVALVEESVAPLRAGLMAGGRYVVKE